MIRPAHVIYALAVLVSYVALLGLSGLIPAAIVLGAWAFVFYSVSRPRALGILVGLTIIGFCLFALLMPPVLSHREASNRSICKNNLKQIGLALHNYHEEYGSFPPANIEDENGEPLLSWRVLLLPYLDQAALYRAFDLRKSWDSPENLAHLKHMSPVFACPSHHSSTQKATTTSYVAVIDPRTSWPGSGSVKIAEMKDGASNIIMVIEQHSDIAWTEPRDLSLEEATEAFAATEIEPFGGHRSESFFNEFFHGRGALFGDGSVQFAPFGLNQTLASELLTIDDHKPAEGWDMKNAGSVPATRTRWRNVILFWTCVFLTLLPLPWVWIHPQGGQKRGQARADEPLNHSSGHRPKGGPP